MKINGQVDNKLPLAPVSGERKSTSTAAAATTTGSKTEPSAKVAISPQASALAATADDGSFDAAKVERVSQAIKEGTFKPNPDAIADKLIANAQELLTRTYR